MKLGSCRISCFSPPGSANALFGRKAFGRLSDVCDVSTTPKESVRTSQVNPRMSNSSGAQGRAQMVVLLGVCFRSPEA